MNAQMKADAAPQVGPKDELKSLYLETLQLVERLHRRLLDVIKDEFDRNSRTDINAVQALLLFNIGDSVLTAGELRTHYAGFFDPGFGYNEAGGLNGTAAVLEVRAHDVAFALEDGQQVCKLSFEQMAEPPSDLYGKDSGSHYQGQRRMLSKHFKPFSGRPG